MARTSGPAAPPVDNDPFWELSNDLLCVADFAGNFTRLNPQWERVLGWSVKELQARPWVEFVHPEDQVRTLQEAERIIDGSETVSFENRYRCKDGTYRWLNWSARSSRRTGEIYATARDVTLARELDEERKRSEAQRRQLDFMKEVNAFNERLLRMTRTEVQPPLEPIKLQLEVLRDTPPARRDPHVENALKVMQRNLERLESVVTEILDAERLQHGTMKLSRDKVDIDLLTQEVVAGFQEAAEIAKVRLEVKARSQCWVDGDAARLRLALAHLLANAVKFTSAGGTVSVEVSGSGNHVELMVRDTGIGMTPEQVDALFQPFARVHDPALVKGLGNGLGLYLAKGIVERHGGRLDASSAGTGKGTTFSVRLPAEAPGPPPSASHGTPKTTKSRRR